MEQFEIINLGTQFIKYKMDDKTITELLELSNKQTQSYREYLVANIQNEYGFEEKDKNKVWEKISLYIKDYIEKLVAPKVPEIRFESRLRNLWVNYQKTSEYNPHHNHPGHISFVIYLQIPEELKTEKNITFSNQPGSITFLHGDTPKIYGLRENIQYQIDNSILPTNIYNHLPVTGEMFVFPAYLNHFVDAFATNDVVRISLAGNTELIGKYKTNKLV
jgi:hypothetical protein